MSARDDRGQGIADFFAQADQEVITAEAVRSDSISKLENAACHLQLCTITAFQCSSTQTGLVRGHG